MKKLLIVAGAILLFVALGVWVLTWFRAPEAVATSAARPWPGGLGTLDAVAARVPPRQANEASAKLAAMAEALPKSEAVDEFVAREISRADSAIGQPPQVPDVSAIRDLLLREPVVWERRGGIADVGDAGTSNRRGMVMTVARALVASALVKARAGDAAAWEDLHAVWKLAAAVDPYPEMMMQTAAFTMARMINGVAWKMPLPAPAWFAELQEREYLPRLLEAYQYQTAAYWRDGARMFPTKWLANSVEHDRQIAESLFKETRCDVNAQSNTLGVDLSFVWRRAFRYRAEREATANAIRVREGKPIETSSRCSDGRWTLEGTMLRFSSEIPTAAPDRAMPLTLQVQP